MYAHGARGVACFTDQESYPRRRRHERPKLSLGSFPRCQSHQSPSWEFSAVKNKLPMTAGSAGLSCVARQKLKRGMTSNFVSLMIVYQDVSVSYICCVRDFDLRDEAQKRQKRLGSYMHASVCCGNSCLAGQCLHPRYIGKMAQLGSLYNRNLMKRK